MATKNAEGAGQNQLGGSIEAALKFFAPTHANDQRDGDVPPNDQRDVSIILRSDCPPPPRLHLPSNPRWEGGGGPNRAAPPLLPSLSSQCYYLSASIGMYALAVVV